MAVTYIGSANAETTTVTIPTHQAGDLILMMAFRDGSTTQGTMPGGWTEKDAEAANTCCARLCYKIAASSSETSGTWTSYNTLVCHVYRQAAPGAALGQTGSSATVTYPALTLDVNAGTSWVAGFGAHRSVNGNMGIAPTGMTNRTNLAGTGSDAAGFDTNGGVISWSSQNVASGETASGYISFVLELTYDDPNDIVYTTDQSGTAVPAGYSCEVTLVGGGGGGGRGASTGASGGGGGSRLLATISASQLGSTFSATAGAAGTAGTSTTGGNGGNSTFTSGGITLTAGGGGGGSNAGATVGTAGVASQSGFTGSTLQNGTAGGAGNTAGGNGTTASNNTGGGAAGGGGGSYTPVTGTNVGGNGGNSLTRTGGTGGSGAGAGGSPAAATAGAGGAGGGASGSAYTSIGTAGAGGLYGGGGGGGARYSLGSSNGAAGGAGGIKIRFYPKVAAISTLTDDFNTGSVPDSAKWDGASSSLSGGKLVIPANDSVAAVNQYELTADNFYLQIFSTGAGGGCAVSDGNNSYGWLFSSGTTVEAYHGVGSGVTRTHTSGDWYRVRESGGTIYYDYSANGTSWTTLHSAATLGPTTDLYSQLIGGSSVSTTLDNFNVAPTAAVDTSKFFLMF